MIYQDRDVFHQMFADQQTISQLCILDLKLTFGNLLLPPASHNMYLIQGFLFHKDIKNSFMGSLEYTE